MTFFLFVYLVSHKFILFPVKDDRDTSWRQPPTTSNNIFTQPTVLTNLYRNNSSKPITQPIHKTYTPSQTDSSYAPLASSEPVSPRSIVPTPAQIRQTERNGGDFSKKQHQPFSIGNSGSGQSFVPPHIIRGLKPGQPMSFAAAMALTSQSNGSTQQFPSKKNEENGGDMASVSSTGSISSSSWLPQHSHSGRFPLLPGTNSHYPIHKPSSSYDGFEPEEVNL